MPEVPGTRYQFVITRDAATGAHRATIAEGDTHAIPALEDLTAAEMVEVITALRAAERMARRLDATKRDEGAQHADRR